MGLRDWEVGIPHMSTSRRNSRQTFGLGIPSLSRLSQFPPLAATVVDIRFASGEIRPDGDPSDGASASGELPLLSLFRCGGFRPIALSSSPYELIEARKRAMRAAHAGSYGPL